jgi:hypothetical protein
MFQLVVDMEAVKGLNGRRVGRQERTDHYDDDCHNPNYPKECLCQLGAHHGFSISAALLDPCRSAELLDRFLYQVRASRLSSFLVYCVRTVISAAPAAISNTNPI